MKEFWLAVWRGLRLMGLMLLLVVVLAIAIGLFFISALWICGIIVKVIGVIPSLILSVIGFIIIIAHRIGSRE